MTFIRHNFPDIAETHILECRIPFKITIGRSGAKKIIISQIIFLEVHLERINPLVSKAFIRMPFSPSY